MKKCKRILSVLLLIAMLLPMLPVTALTAFAASVLSEDAMVKIEADSELTAHKVGETLRESDDGYIGIPYEVSVYYDYATHGKAKAGYMTNGATPMIMYVVNTNVERIGTESDVTIIKSMLSRGYIVVVADYLNDARAKSPALEWSTQLLRAKALAGDYLKDSTVFESGSYVDTLTVPAGYDVRLNDVYFELDKHGVDGTLEEIVSNWNNDFRGVKASKIVKWVHTDGTRKTTQNAPDGSSPVWYADAEGKTVDNVNGQYTKVGYTKAETITDCVRPDGSPIDFNLYSHLVYPTKPANDVPLMVLYSSSGSLGECINKANRPHFAGFLFGGYAGMIAEYSYIPMSRSDAYNFAAGDSAGGVTGINMTYATYTYNATQSASAALRFARYLALSEPDTYRIDIDHFGAFGISKTAWYTQLGAPVLRENLLTGKTDAEVAQHVNDKINSFVQMLLPDQCSGRTRYDNGDVTDVTFDGMTVDGGELQPWASYAGNEISSGVQANYSSCGAFLDYFTEGYAPQFITENLQDTSNTEYGQQNIMVNLCRNMNIPALWFEVNIAHDLAQNPDYNHGVDTYNAFHAFMAYYLKGAPVSVCYTTPANGGVIRTTDGITVKFIGEVSATEIEKVKVTDGAGNALTGTWTSAYGNTEWTFLADSMKGGTAYTLTVPATLVGENGVAMGTAYTTSFYSRAEGDVTALNGAATLDENGKTVTVTVPEKTADGFKLRVNVTNDAANTLYAYNAANGALMGSVRVSGKGFHEIDVTDDLASYAAGTEIAVTLKTAKSAGTEAHYNATFDSGTEGLGIKNSAYTEGQEIDGELALKIVRTPDTKTGDYSMYPNMENAYTISTNKLIKNGSAVNKSDLGRTFLITIRVYDTVSRPIHMYMNSATQRTTQRIDHDRVYYNFFTEANEWCEFTVPYTVYEMKYGWKTQVKDLFVQFTPLGGKDAHPIYLDNLEVVELFTDIDVSSVSVVSTQDSDKNVQAPVGTNPFKVGETEYATWKQAINAATSGATVTMQSNYVLTGGDIVSLSGKSSLTIDLGGYRLTAKNSYDAPLWLSATDTAEVNVTLKNGIVILGDTPLVAYGSSTAAGSGKVLNVNIEDIYLTVAKDSDSFNVVSNGSIASGVKVSSNISLTDCVIDVEREHLPEWKSNNVNVLHAGNADVTVRYTFVGGVLKMNSFHEAIIGESLVTVKKNAEGEYLKVYAPASVETPTLSLKMETAYGSLKASGTESGYTVYSVAEADHSTAYGAIPNEYADAAKYPFAIFMDEAFIAGAPNWKTTNEAVKTALTNKPGATVQVLLRADYTSETYIGNANWLCYMNGNYVLDLGGNTMLSSQSLFEAGVDASYTGSFHTSFTVKNGTVLVGSGNMCGAQQNSNYNKTMDVTFENVTFGLDETFTTNRNKLFYGSNNNSVTAVLTLNLTLKNCTFDLRGIPCAYTVFAYGNTAKSVSANVTVIGGSILTDSTASNITWYTLDSTGAADTLLFEKGSDGKYITMSVPNGTTPTAAFPTSDGVFGFGEPVSDGAETDVYTLKNDTVASPYGSIPGAYAANTFVLFKDGACIGAKDTWKDTLTLTRETLAANPGKTVQILMQKDRAVTSYVGAANWLCYMNGSILLDMNGHTLTASTTSLFEVGCDANYTGSYKTTLTVKNGTVLQGKGNVCGIQNNCTYEKAYDITFQGVTFGIASNFAEGSKNTLFYAQTNCKANVDVSLTLNDCTLNLSGIDRAYTVFSFASSDTYVSADIALNGGAIIADSFDTLTFLTMDSTNDTFVWGKGTSGAYATLTLPAAYTLTKVISGVNVDGTYVSFSDGTVDGESRVYTLKENQLVTEYGVIGEDAADADAYPLVLFDANKNFISGQPAWGNAITAAKNYLSSRSGKTVYVLLRKDHNAGSSSAPHLGLLVGTIEVDLGGHTLTRGSNSMLEGGTNGMTEAMSQQTATVNIRNGKILAGKSSSSSGHLVTYQSHVNYNKTINITFEDVTFGVTAGITNITSVITRSWGAASGITGVTTSTLTLRNCIFDFSGSTGTNVPASTTLIHTSGSGTAQNIAVVFEGGTFKGTHSGITLTAVDSTDSVKFVKGANGKYLEFDLTAGTPSASGVTTDRGTMYFAKKSGNLYTLAVKASECGNALIPYEYYDDVSTYPFVVYTEGNLVSVSNAWKAAQTSAQSYLESNNGKTVYVLMRRDVNGVEWFKSAGVFNGTVVLDLGGHTLHRKDNSFLEACTNGLTEEQCAFVSSIIVKNGKLLAAKSANDNGHIVAVQSNTDYNKTFNITFENVTFGISKANYVSEKGLFAVAIRDNGTASGKTGVVTASFLFENCTFDFTDGEETAVPSKDTTVIYTKPSSARNNINITFAGGTFKGTHQKITFINPGDKTTVTYVPNDDGEYFKYDLSAGTPNMNAVDTDKGDGYFYSAGNGVYRLGIGKAAFTGASLNLGADLSILYYVRIHDATLPSLGALSARFTVNGKSVTVSDYTVVNGEYVFKLSGLAPQQIADLVDAVFLVGETEITSHKDYSIRKNLISLRSKDAATLGLSAEKHAALVTLIEDLLLYGAAAQDYTGYKPEAPVLDGLEGIEGSDALPDESDARVVTGNTDPTLRFSSATVFFDTVNAIRIRISVDVADESLVTITANGKTYTLDSLAKLSDGVYLATFRNIPASAFDAVQTVSLAYDGETVATLSYSVNAYAYAMQESETAGETMKALALALYRYGASTDAYASIA